MYGAAKIQGISQSLRTAGMGCEQKNIDNIMGMTQIILRSLKEGGTFYYGTDDQK